MASTTPMSKSQSTSARCSCRQLASNPKCVARSPRLLDFEPCTRCAAILSVHSSAQVLGYSRPARASSMPMHLVSVLHSTGEHSVCVVCVHVCAYLSACVCARAFACASVCMIVCARAYGFPQDVWVCKRLCYCASRAFECVCTRSSKHLGIASFLCIYLQVHVPVKGSCCMLRASLPDK